MDIRPDHPLRRMFDDLVARRIGRDANVADPEVAAYVAGVLAAFVDVRRMYALRNAQGRRLDDIGELLVESNPLLEARSFDREREVRKHIGDYTMFLAGLFPEYVARLPRRTLRLDALVDYVQAGKESYRIVSFFDQAEFRDEAALFRKLAENFELCVFGLNLVKRDLDRMRQDWYARARAVLDNPIVM